MTEDLFSREWTSNTADVIRATARDFSIPSRRLD